MYRQHVTPQQLTLERLPLHGECAHHLQHVLRVTIGTEVCAFDGEGHTRMYHVAEVTSEGILLEAKLPIYAAEHPPVRVVLFACIPKGDRMEWMLEKATELGVSEIVPVMSARTVVKLDCKQAEAKRARWQRIVEAAARQCGAAFVPTVAAPVKLKETVEQMKQCTTLIVAALIPDAQPLDPVLQRLDPTVSEQTWGWWCGPEGDFSPDELQLILSCGAIPVTLGPLILRAETAAIYGMAAMGCRRYAKTISNS